MHHLGMRPRLAAMLCALVGGCAVSPGPPAISHRPTTPIAPGPAWTPAPPARARPPEVDTGRGLAQAIALPRRKVVVTVTCGLTILEPIRFQPASTELTPPLLAAVDQVAKTIVRLQADQTLAFEIVGHADAAERDPRGLALARARTIAAALHARGVRDIEGVRGVATASGADDRVDFLIVRR